MEPYPASEAKFGVSQFKGKTDLASHLHRWLVQFWALSTKNALIMMRKPLQTLLFLLLPSIVFLPFLVEMSGSSSGNSAEELYPAIPISGLGECDSYYSSTCIQIVYGPKTTMSDAIMQSISSANNLNFGKDVRGFGSEQQAQYFVAENLGKVQFTVFFRNSSIWETSTYSPENVPLSKNMSYAIFFNSSRNNDPRSSNYGINFPLLVLQKELEEFYMQYEYGGDFALYDLNYGNTWSVPEPTRKESLGNSTSTPCEWTKRDNMAALGSIVPWVISFVFLLMSSISFQAVADERRKHLFNSLRRLGLLDSAYWASWFVTFQVLLVGACIVALVVAACIRPHSPALQNTGLDLMFLLLWLSGTAFVSMSFFLAAFCNSSATLGAITFAEFLICLITISLCSSNLNSFTVFYNTDGSTSCYRVTSSYNTIFSSSLTGNDFVQFLVFFLPWFHASMAITDIVSTVQYKGQSQDMSGIAETVRMSYSGGTVDLFDSEWISWPLIMLTVETVVFMIAAWFAAQLLSANGQEGRPILSVLIPQFIRDYVFTQEVIYPGDVRGIEKERSRVDNSVRVYKVSKTFTGVQALKEVSFSLAKGEVFVLLGHNGAGKSTLINIITGLIAPTHGKVFINGLDVESDVAEIQQSIGVCPQDDLLWDDLTAREHMYLTAAFKGCVSGAPLAEAVNYVLKRVELLGRADDFARQYSGGMKRRLSAAMSTVGDVDLLFLDEPTTGLDPISRRNVWDTINWMKKDRVVILTTHNMEEADFLADTIMIMHQGHVRAWGDPLFLKQTYGKGYQVNLSVDPVNIPEVNSLIHNVLPNPVVSGGGAVITAGLSHDAGVGAGGALVPAGQQQQQQVVSRQLNESRSASGMLQITVPKGDMRGLPRLFAWLESSKRARAIVLEWGVSNTTLEQVFLMLCEQNTNVNYSAAQGDPNDAIRMNSCPMCRKHVKETVFLRSLVSGKAMLVADSICSACANGNPFFELEEDRVRVLLTQTPAEQLAQEKVALLRDAQVSSEAAATKQLLELEDRKDAEYGLHDVDWAEGMEGAEHQQAVDEASSEAAAQQSITPQLPNSEAAGQEPLLGQNGVELVPQLDSNPLQHAHIQMHAGGAFKPASALVPSADRYTESVSGSTAGQIRAIMVKNLGLQARQRCSNCCSVCFVGTMFLFLYLLGLIFAPLSDLRQCSQGYLVAGYDCSMEELTDHLFSGADGNMVQFGRGGDDDTFQDDDNSVPSSGYNIEYAFVPSAGYAVETFGNAQEHYMYYGLPIPSNYRTPIVWTSLADNSTLDKLLHEIGLNLNTRSLPYAASLDSDAPNSYMYSQQEAIYDYMVSDANEYPYCSVYDPNTLLGTESSSADQLLQDFSENFAEAAFVCPTCATVSAPNQLYFDGTMWVAQSKNNKEYPFAFNDYMTFATVNASYGGSCPPGFEYFSLNYERGTGNQLGPVMTYLNLLTNLIIDPTLSVYNVQGGLSAFSSLLFNAAQISQTEANILTIVAMLLLNGFWPVAVWRLSHERSLDIVLMMRTVGMKASSYVGAMFLFDMLISVISGVLMIVFASELKLSRFEDAPIGYLVAIVILSAWALNAGSQLAVRILGKKSSILPMLAPCVMVASTAAAPLLTILVYPNDGDWPNALSLYPFFAQGRALYVVLTYHKTTEEVDTALGLLFFFGFVCLALTFVIEAQLPILHESVVFVKKEYIKLCRSQMKDLESAPLLSGSSNGEGGHAASALHPDENSTLAEGRIEKGGSLSAISTSAATAGGAANSRGNYRGVQSVGPADSLMMGQQQGSGGGTSGTSGGTYEHSDVDEDVVNENIAAMSYRPPGFNGTNVVHAGEIDSSNRFAIVIQKLSHCFDELSHHRVLAVNELSLALKYGECFGLLGPNGAGKSTTMSILCGALRAMEGDVYIAGHSLLSHDGGLFSQIGCCPQFDVVWPDLTVSQHLAFQARQRGVSEGRVSAEVQAAALSVGLDGDGFYTLAGQLSGGMRRRLSIAMSIVGNPPIIFMDEPTTGLDPDNRAHVWRIIQNLKNPNRLILMTTHSMEEAEALCSRIGIMAKGRLRCVGSSQHLKTKFGKGYVLTVNMLPSDGSPQAEAQVAAALEDFVHDELGKGSAKLLSSINRTKKFLIYKSSQTTISELFRNMEANKERLQIREWGLSMSTLEDVFVSAVHKSATEKGDSGSGAGR